MNIRVGYFGKPHGIRGEIRLKVFPETGWKPQPGAVVESTNKKGNAVTHRILDIRKHQDFYLVQCSDVTTRDQAQLLTGCEVRAQIEKLPDDTLLLKDLIGSSVKTADGRYLGRIIRILETGSNDIYTVEDNGKEILIPALKSIVRQFNREIKELVVHLPEGLEE